jgi:carbamoyl-phosphate synthase large subunit
MVGQSLDSQGIHGEVFPRHFAVKESVFPFIKFPGVDSILGPEMKSTGEVMGLGHTFGEAFRKSQLAAGNRLPQRGSAFISVRSADKPAAMAVARDLAELGFALIATRGTAAVIRAQGLEVTEVNKATEGRPHIVDWMIDGKVQMVINTTEPRRSVVQDSRSLRTTAVQRRIPYFTTIAGARAAVAGLRHAGDTQPYDLQTLHAELAGWSTAATVPRPGA